MVDDAVGAAVRPTAPIVCRVPFWAMAAGSRRDVPTLQDPLDTVGADDHAPAGVELDVGRRLILSALRRMRRIYRCAGEKLIDPLRPVQQIAGRAAAVSGQNYAASG